MAREVVWTLQRYTLVCEQGMLNPEDCDKLRMHIMRCSNLEIAMKYSVDISVIDSDMKRYKLIYDAVQKQFPDILDPRNKGVYRKKKHCF